jgi:hypothetical protein
VLEFRNIFEQTSREIAQEQIVVWIKKTKSTKLGDFNTAANSLKYHLETILNFFEKRYANAKTQSSNSKVKLFRANLKGVVDGKFFLFGMEKLCSQSSENICDPNCSASKKHLVSGKLNVKKNPKN